MFLWPVVCRNDSITGSYNQTKISFSYKAKYSICKEMEFMGMGSWPHPRATSILFWKTFHDRIKTEPPKIQNTLPNSRTQKHRCFPHHFPFCIISASINISGHLPVGGASGVSCGHLTHNVCRVFYLPRTGHSPLSSPCFPWFPNDTGPGCTSGLGAQSSGTGVTEHGARQEYLYRISELLLTLAWQTTFMLLNVTMTA